MRKGLIPGPWVFAAFVALAAAAPALAEVRYQVTSLGQFIPTGINEHGQVSGYTGWQGQGTPGWKPSDMHAALWLPAPAYGLGAGLNDLGNPSAPGGTPHAADINDFGQIAGYGMVWLPSPAYGHPAGWSTIANTGPGGPGSAINNSGQVAGVDLSREQAILWLPVPTNGLSAGTHVLDMPDMPISRGSGSADINNNGQVVGNNKTSAGMRAFLQLPAAAYGMPAGTYHLPTLEGTINSYATGISDRGQVTGWTINDPNGDPAAVRSFLWLPEDDAANGRPAGLYDLDSMSSGLLHLRPEDINSAGYIVGGQNYANADGVSRAFIWDPATGRASDLNSLVDPALGWHFSHAHAINDSGQIVGWGSRNGVQQAVLLTLPEPSSLSLVAVAALATLRRPRAKRGA